MAKQKPAADAFAPTHERIESGELVRAVRWVKDGDHPDVVRYPIEKRDYKGLLVIDAKTRFALRYGDWILEDAVGRRWVMDARECAAQYAEVK